MEKLDFQGRTLLITRPQPEADATARQVHACHGQPCLAPALIIQPPRHAAPFQQAMQQLDRYDGILLTSANGARAFLKAVPPGRTPPPLFAVGKKTAHLLKQHGWHAHVPPASIGGENLAHAVMTWRDNTHRFLFPQAEQGRDDLTMLLQQAGYGVDRVVAYRAEPLTHLPAETASALAEGRVDATLFFSGRTAQAFVAALPPEGEAWLKKTCIAVLSPITAETVESLGYPVSVTAREPSREGLLTALHQYWFLP